MQPAFKKKKSKKKKASFLKHNEAIRHEAWQDGNNKQNEETDPAVFLQNRREATGLVGQSKKENMDLVKKGRHWSK